MFYGHIDSVSSIVHLHVSASFVVGILTPMDEFTYWAEMSSTARNANEKDRAAAINELFNPIAKVLNDITHTYVSPCKATI